MTKAYLFLRIVIILVVLPYIAVPVYRFPAARPFSGAQLWNPYEHLAGPWRRANFHAHGQSWGGITHGEQSDVEVAAAYRAAGYDIAGLSDYQRIADIDLVPAYEHGYNIAKHHQLALGAHAVVWWDLPLWQGVNEKQFLLNRLRPVTDVISINHPSRLHSYTVEDVRELTGYELMEVANGRVITDDRWDAALSTGHPVWAIGGDDTHDVTDTNRFGVAWTMIATPALTANDVLTALRRGQSYVVVRKSEAASATDVGLASLTTEGSRVTVTISGPPSEVSFSSEDGVVRQQSTGQTASYEMTPADPYIRAVIHTANADLYLNPVLRTSGGMPRAPDASIDWWWTAGRSLFLVAICLAAGFLHSRRGARR